MNYHTAVEFILANYKMFLGAIGGILGAVAYLYYYIKMFSPNGTKPCVFTWVPLATIVGFGLFAQISTGALWGALVMGVTAVNCIACAVISLFYFKRSQKSEWTDWLCFFCAIAAIIWWRTTSGLILPVILISAADLIAFIPTWKRGWQNPFGESFEMWFINFVKFLFGIAAIKMYHITTLLFPLTILFINGSMALIILTRRSFLSKKEA